MRDHYDRGPSRKDSDRYDNRDRRPSYNRDDRTSDRGEREMFSAVCDECGRNCQVPFRPSSDKPIYCLDCYEKMNGSNFKRDSFKDRPNGDSNIQRQLDDINHKLYKILKLLESKPSEPVYNKMNPVKKREKKEDAEKSFDAILKQIDEIESK